LGVLIDAGTNNQEFLDDPAYIGLRQTRERGPAYDELITEFMTAAQELYGENVLLQFEDFGNANAFRLLYEWEKKACSFNDDIQGTAAVALSGLLAAKRVTGRPSLKDETFLFLGAGEAALGIADLIAYAIVKETGMSMEDARRNIWLFDSKGLIVEGRGHLTEHKAPYAHAGQAQHTTFIDAVKSLRPTGIIGVSTIAKAFNQEVLETMAEINKQPIVFALSNPTSKSECTFEEAVQYTKGTCIFASGSPFPALTYEGKTLVPGQANNW
jgi:malate dehydrogenase (oxaloacetate-decarboxylating)(NADP+)